MKTFLSPEQWKQAEEVFPPVFWTPNGDVRFTGYFGGPQFSGWLGTQLEENLKQVPGFYECEPVILGSWSRSELCPNSDIDVLFCADDAKVQALTERLHESGLRLRYRVPKNPEDWTEGVESFDVLALWKAKPLTSAAASKLLKQQKNLWEQKKHLRKQLLKDLLHEHHERNQRHSSISNYLEPNLKYGPGCLRDIEQALQVYELYSEKFQNPGHALQVLQYHRAYLLTLRQKLHLMGYGDVLVSTAQFDLANFFRFKNHKDFMRDLERGLSRSHFYVNWIFAVAESAETYLKKIGALKIASAEDMTAALKKHPEPLAQQKVRENLDHLLTEKWVQKSGRIQGRYLDMILDPKASPDFLSSVFESRLIDKLLPAIRHLIGYVQHDQYHRYTADVHIQQACLWLKNFFKSPKGLGALAPLHKELTAQDWKILSWACLYHDLAKGLHAESHSDLGTEILRKDFRRYGFSKKFQEEVAWLVKNHLELSIAAFRKNPKSRKTWEDLEQIGAKGIRLQRLAIFTVIDICATNPEAWNEWKGKLLKSLVDALNSSGAQSYFSLKNSLKIKKLKNFESFLEDFDDFLLESIPAKLLAEDLQSVQTAESSLPPKVWRKNAKEVWIRFHSHRDQEGLLAAYVQKLYSLGLGIRHAAVQTLPKVGVYDWFQVTTSKSPQVLEKILQAESKPAKLPQVEYDHVEWVSFDDKEWVISFKGKDQSGFLGVATQALSEAGLNIKSARVHTWGRQVNDLFTLKTNDEAAEEVLQKIHQKLQA